MQRFDLKLVLIGDSRVGKSQLSRSFVGKNFLVKFLYVCPYSERYM